MIAARRGARRPAAGDRAARRRRARRSGRGRRAASAARIAAAGLDVPSAEVMALKAGGAVAGLAAATWSRPLRPGGSGSRWCAALPAAGFLAPDPWLRRPRRARARAIEDELADVLDLLRVAVAAGLAPKRALAEVGRHHHGVLAAELHRAAARSALGVPFGHALDELERRARRPASCRWSPRCAGPSATARRSAGRSPPRRRRPAPPARSGGWRRPHAPGRRSNSSRALLVPAVLLLVAAALLPALTG